MTVQDGEDQARDELLEEMERTESAASVTRDDLGVVIRRLRRARGRRLQGASYREIAEDAPTPLAVELLRSSLARLMGAFRRLQPAAARALRQEGMSMGEIARRFGISRPRISRLLGRTDPEPPPSGTGAEPAGGR